jgi:hypothetical protein
MNMSAPGMYTAVAVAKEKGEPTPTILYDEVDQLFERKDTADIISIMNGGYRRGAKVIRGTYTEGKRSVEELDAFCPVLLSGIDTGRIRDTILDRSIIIRMRRRKSTEKVEPYRPRDHDQEGLALRDQLSAWAKENLERAKDMRPELPPGIVDRDADIWEPLLICAACAGGDGCDAPRGWGSRIEQAALASLNQQEDIEPATGTLLLNDIRTIYNTTDMTLPIHNNRIWTEAVLTRLNSNPEAPWASFYGNGRPLDDRGLVKLLRPYGIHSKTVRFGSKTAKGYDFADFHDAWNRYLETTPPATAVTSVTEVTSVTKVQDRPAIGGF